MMAKRRKPGRPGKNLSDLLEKNIPGEKKAPGRHDRLAQELRSNLKKRKGQAHTKMPTRSSQRGK